MLVQKFQIDRSVFATKLNRAAQQLFDVWTSNWIRLLLRWKRRDLHPQVTCFSEMSISGQLWQLTALWGFRHDQNRTWCRPGHFAGDRRIKQCLKPRPVRGSNHDNISITVIGIVGDGLFDLAAAHFNLSLNARPARVVTETAGIGSRV
jgi:hypothetical protein